VAAIVALIFVNRSFSASLRTAFGRSNRALKFVLIGVAGILGLTLFWPPAAMLFRFGPLHFDDLAVALGVGLAVLVVLELMKSH
jgi:Ca2+-transporting ATPase